MKSNIKECKIGLFILFVLAFSLNSFSQTIIYQTGFENFKDSTMLGTTLSVANDNWRVSNNAVQVTEASTWYCMAQLRPKDEYRNAWTVSDAWHWQPFAADSNVTIAREIRPISHKTLAMCAYWGATGTTSFESQTCLFGLEYIIASGFMGYFTNLVTNRWAYRVIPTTGYSNITVSFLWKCNGTASYQQDYGQVGYSLDGGTTWTWLTTGGTVNGHYQGEGTVNQSATVNLPTDCNNQSNFAIGFGFICAGHGTDQDLQTGGYPGFAIDNLVVKGSTRSCNGVTITSQPVSVHVCIPGSASFSITVADSATTPISYQWQVSPSWKNVVNNAMYSGSSTSSLTVTNPTTTLQYRCIASNCSPVVYATSNAATLTVQAPVKVDPSFYNKYQCIGDSVAFTIEPTAGTATFSYQWLQNGKPVTDGKGGTTSLFYNSSISYSDTGTYSCIITNVCNSVTGRVVHLTVPVCNRTHHPISGNVTYDNSNKSLMTSETAKTTTNVYLYNSAGDTIIQTTQTDNFGNYEFINLVNGAYWISGNSVKPWGGGNPADALIINRVYINLQSIKDPLWKAAGDVNLNGQLDPVDALEINRRYINLISKFTAAPDWCFQKIQVEMSSVPLIQNIEAECYGDVNGSYPSIPARLVYTPVNISGSMSISSGQQFEIPVYINSNIDLGALGLKFKVQSSKYKVLGVKSDVDGLIYNVTDDGINIAWSATDNAINVTADKPVLMLQGIYTGIQNPEALLLSQESIITDINVNTISNDNIVMPRLIISSQQQQPSASLICYPNPCSNITNIAYTIPEDLNVKIDIYNVLGEKVSTLVNCIQKSGKYTVKFDGTNLKRGVYYCKIEATNSTSAFCKTDILMLAR